MSDQLGCLFDQLKTFDRPPVEKWWPEKTIPFDLRIVANGDWIHEGGKISRQPLVKLFSTVLCRREGMYLLVTPAVQYQISVEDVPFLVVEMSSVLTPEPEIHFRTNMDEVVTLDREHPLNLRLDPVTGSPSPVIEVRDGLLARLIRPVFYQLVELAQPLNQSLAPDSAAAESTLEENWGVTSCGEVFLLH